MVANTEQRMGIITFEQKALLIYFILVYMNPGRTVAAIQFVLLMIFSISMRRKIVHSSQQNESGICKDMKATTIHPIIGNTFEHNVKD